MPYGCLIMRLVGRCNQKSHVANGRYMSDKLPEKAKTLGQTVLVDRSLTRNHSRCNGKYYKHPIPDTCTVNLSC